MWRNLCSWATQKQPKRSINYEKNQIDRTGKIIGFSALVLALAVTAFIGSNNLVFAAATKPETIPMSDAIKISQMSTNTASDEYQTPKLSVVWEDNDGAIDNQPRAGAMGYEKASQLGARYKASESIWKHDVGSHVSYIFCRADRSADSIENRFFKIIKITSKGKKCQASP